ncbi:Uncharacterised protein [Candidatus Venteria ishoeyi]|uniref:Uncharacterized protein n=2 Tax=Candidatus Venteria ishoeyi TaxID=1899563 RepID=A0A1H6FCM8_9GAMM|nr:Uncharacterised protein [Candidatus Venteria ishoeyi]
MHQENNFIDLKQEYLSPPVQKSGYNPLSWAASVYLAPLQPGVFLSSTNPEGEALLTYIESGLQQPSVFNGGIRVELRGRNFLFESGLGFFQLSQKANYQTLDIFYRDTTIYSNWDSSYTKFDTVDVYWQAFGTDTVFQYQITDSLIGYNGIATTIDSIPDRDEQSLTFTNTYKYLEVPLIVGYGFTKNVLPLP